MTHATDVDAHDGHHDAPRRLYLTQDVDHQVVNPEAFEAALDNATGAFLLDVRTTAEWEDGHLEGSILIPHLDLEAR